MHRDAAVQQGGSGPPSEQPRAAAAAATATGEVVGEGGVRIKFAAHRTGPLPLAAVAAAPVPDALRQLATLMHRLEDCGVVPVLEDGLVGGNCAITAAAAAEAANAAAAPSAAPPVGSSGGWDASSAAAAAASRGSIDIAPGSGDGGTSSSRPAEGILISRSGKQPGVPLAAADWVLLTRFDPGSWQADHQSAGEGTRPSSDAPLHAAALGPGAARRYGWAAAPAVAVHGHALAAGAGLERARQHGLPISDCETLFSTRQDLAALETLFRTRPYPSHQCYIRRGHGFLLLAPSVPEAEQYFQQRILPLLCSTASGPAPHCCTAAEA